MTRLKTNFAHYDTILLDMTSEDLNGVVIDALKMYRDGDVLALSTSPLAQSSLIEIGRLAGEQISSDSRGRLTQSLLRWAVERIRPSREHNWLLSNWRAYNILYHFYIEGMRASELSEKMAIAEQTLYQSRPQAISIVSALLRQEIIQPTDERGRRHYALSGRYVRYNELEQKLLRSISVFPSSIPTDLIYKLVSIPDIDVSVSVTPSLANIQTSIHHLVTNNLLISNEHGSELVLQPDMRQFILTMLLPNERKHLYCAASKHYLEQEMFLDAAENLRKAGEHRASAKIIIEHQRDIVDNLQIEELSKLVAQFTQQELANEREQKPEVELWHRLKIVAGEIAEFNKDVDAAVEEYRQALAASDKQTKALAYYKRAKAFEYKNMDESLAHYDYAIRLMEDLNGDAPQSILGFKDAGTEGKQNSLLVRMYIDQSWIFLQQRPDLRRAEVGLHKAQELIDREDRLTWADLHNALGAFYLKKEDQVQTESHYWQAWLAANEIHDLERMTNMSHNLGYHLCVSGKYQEALEYLDKSLTLSVETSNRPVEVACEMSIGICHFYLEDYKKALKHYRQAATISAEIGNLFFLSRSHFNLAETYIKVGNAEQMQYYFSEGLRIATEAKDEGAKQDFIQLLEKHPQLSAHSSTSNKNLSERQQQALEHVKEHGQITNREYQEIMDVSQKQAVRDLNDLLEKGILARVGKGRATCYKLPTTKMALEHSV